MPRIEALEYIIEHMKQSGWGIPRFASSIALLDDYLPTREVVSLSVEDSLTLIMAKRIRQKRRYYDSNRTAQIST